MRVGLIGPPGREELERIELRLEERGVEALVIDPRGEPEFELAPGNERVAGVELGKLAAFYVADLGLSSAPPGAARGEAPDAEERARLIERSQRRLVLWNTLLGRLALRARVINPPHTWDLHGQKPFEVEAYRVHDLPVPRTITTSSPEALLELPADVERWITKGLVGGYGYTQAFEPPSTRAQAQALLADGPRLVQQRIEGDNVRAFVAGGELLGAAEVHSADPTEVDSRRDTARLRRVTLPEQARHVALVAARLLQIPFTAVDLMREASSGRYWLLECNSAPFFVEFERQTGIDVSSAVADLLTGRRDRPSAP